MQEIVHREIYISSEEGISTYHGFLGVATLASIESEQAMLHVTVGEVTFSVIAQVDTDNSAAVNSLTSDAELPVEVVRLTRQGRITANVVWVIINSVFVAVRVVTEDEG